MRNIVFKLLLLIGFLLNGCGDNSYDGESGLRSGGNNTDVSAAIESIYSVVQTDADKAYNLAVEVASLVDESNSTQDDFETLRTKMQELILAYKRVETVYIAGKLQSSMIDIPVYVEAFSAGDIDRKRPILNELENILDPSNTTSMESALYKNAYKSITGLVYALYANQESVSDIYAKLDTRRISAIHIMIDNIIIQLELIRNFYNNDDTFLADSQESLTILLNQMAISSNRLKEWRIGDPGGITQKYSANPNAELFEYYASKSSLEAIQAIAQTHKSVLENGLYEIADAGGAKSEADAIAEHINKILNICASFTNAIEEDVNNEKITELYNATYVLQNDYTALINALNFQQDIIEADGD